MDKEKPFIHQWHETHRIEEGGIVLFLKKYEPGSYEIKNEISWLLSNMIQSCKNFAVPQIHEASIEQGYVKMNFIEEDGEQKPDQEVVDYLVTIAGELHDLLKSDTPRLRNPVSKTEYPQYLKTYTKQRVSSLEGSEFELPPEISAWIEKQINELAHDYFTVVHRDLRVRHLLFPKDGPKPVLIDWEFSNISHPAQDIAKIIYDATTRGLDRKVVHERVLGTYAQLRGLSASELEAQVRTFLPVIPLERSMSLIKRKPSGYEGEILKDLYFIKSVYDERM